jgi:hypothetical protein
VVVRRAKPRPREEPRRRTEPRRRAFAALVGILLLSAAGVGQAQAADVKLVLLPVDQPGPYFDVTMRPGERRSFEVTLGDAAAAPMDIRTYAADVYTIVNGGFGGRLRDEARTGMTGWLEYPTETMQLRPGQSVHRPFTVSVPPDAEPGEYISSVVLENEVPIHADGSFAVDQFVRQAVAVVVTVPGPRTPGLTIGAARHEVVAGRSIVSIAVANTGNIRLKPAVGFTLFDAAGAQVSRTSLQMDSFYARTDTRVEIALASLLLPGTYTIRLTLDDSAEGARAEEAAIPLVVVAVAVSAPALGATPELTAVDQGPGPTGAILLWPIASLVGLLAVIALGLVARMVRRRGDPGIIGP